MKVKVDRQADALYIRLDESRIVESEDVQPGVIFDYDQNDRVVGIEVLNISSRAEPDQLASIHFQTC